MADFWEFDKRHVAVDDVQGIKLSFSEDSLLVEIEGDEVWIPISQFHADSAVRNPGDSGQLVITKYIAEKRELWDE